MKVKCKVVKYGAGGLHICVRRSDKFYEGQIIEIENSDGNEGLTEKRVREIIEEEINKIRGNY